MIFIYTKIIDIFDLRDIENINLVSCLLKSGKIGVVPTETVYGLACNIYDECAVNRVYDVKKRPKDNPLITHVCNLSMAQSLVFDPYNTIFLKLAKSFWPGPLTIICKASSIVPYFINCGLGSIAIRMPKNDVFLNIIKNAGVPIAAPSANLSGYPSPTKFSHAFDDLNKSVDFIVNSNDCQLGIESTVVSIIQDRVFMLRPGTIKKQDIENVLGIDVLEAYSSNLEDSGLVSPGLKYKHYSPKTNIVLVDCSCKSFKKFIKENDKNLCVLCYEEEFENFKDNKCINIGKYNFESDICHNLFSSLRKIDKLNVDVGYIRIDSKIKGYKAFYNRVLKSSGYEVIAFE